MKIKKTLKFQNKLVKLKLMQTKAYNKKHYFDFLQLEDIAYRLKKICHIIHKYNVLNKSILFIGIPLKVISQLQQLTQNKTHIFLPTFVWLHGLLSNKKSKPSGSKLPFKLISRIRNKIELVVIFTDTEKREVLQESYQSRIPTLVINTKLETQNDKADYKVPGDLDFHNGKISDNVFYSLLVATLKKHPKFHKIKNGS